MLDKVQNSRSHVYIFQNRKIMVYIKYVGMFTISPYTKFPIPNSDGLIVLLCKLRKFFMLAMFLAYIQAIIHISPRSTNIIFRHDIKWFFCLSHLSSPGVRHFVITDRRKLWNKHGVTTTSRELICLLSFVRSDERAENFNYGAKKKTN